MAVDDHGLEAIRKSAEEVNSGDHSNYVIKTIAGHLKKPYDAVTFTYPSSTQEVIYLKQGGTSGTTVATITVNYTDSTKVSMLNWSVV